jgi:hypothetical protein
MYEDDWDAATARIHVEQADAGQLGVRLADG